MRLTRETLGGSRYSQRVIGSSHGKFDRNPNKCRRTEWRQTSSPQQECRSQERDTALDPGLVSDLASTSSVDHVSRDSICIVVHPL